MKAYYAHCMALYKKPQEARDISTLELLGFQVINPGDSQTEEIVSRIKDSDARMAYFERYADECDLIAFRALPDGSIPSGVAMELNWFRKRNKPILELPSALSRRMISLALTREYLYEVGQR